MDDIKRLLVIIGKGVNNRKLNMEDKHFLFNIEKELDHKRKYD